MIKCRDMLRLFMEMEMCMKDTGRTTRSMAREGMSSSREIKFMRENGIWIQRKVLSLKEGKKIRL